MTMEAAAPAETVIEIRGLTTRLGRFQLGPLDMTVPRGAIYGFVGPNGAGKTVTFEMMLGMGKNDGGSITIFGQDHWREETAIKQRLGYYGPEMDYSAWGRVGRVLSLYRGFFPDWDQDYCTRLMTRFGLRENQAIRQMSFGEKTKLGLVAALSHKPSLVILDEPITGLDAVVKQEVYRELLEAVQDPGRTVLISSHNLADIERFADYLGIIHEGKLLLEGPAAQLVERFRIAECGAGELPLEAPGIRVLEKTHTRARLLIDTQAISPANGAARFLEPNATEPLTLEELFVALVKEPGR